jgi:amino acid transporter
MGLSDTTLFLVVAVASPRWIATAAAAGPSSLLIWVAALVTFFVPLAFTVLELSSRHPEEGGIYVWTKAAFGDFAGFMTGWMYWASNLVYFPGLLYFTAANALPLAGARGAALADDPPWIMGISLAALALSLALNLRGLTVGKWLHNVGAVATWVPVAVLAGLAALAIARFGPANEFHGAVLLPATGLEDVIFWSTIAFAFSGLEAASLMGGEIEGARTTLPRAILVSGAIITAIYLLGTAAMLVTLPRAEVSSLQGLVQAIGRAGDRLALPALGWIAAAFMTLSNVGGVSAWLAAAGRLPFVAGLDRHLPPAFGRLHPRWGTPAVALWVQAAGAAGFIVIGQAGASVRAAYDALVGMAVIVYFVPYLFMFATLIRVQGRPAGPGVRRVPGGPVVAVTLAVLGLATTGISIALALMPPAGAADPALAVLRVALPSGALLAVGVLLYLTSAARRARARAT